MRRRQRAQRWTTARMPAQAGRRVVITGANSGIGLETARVLAEAGAHVVMAVRTPARGEAAAASIRGTVEVRRLDLSDLASVQTFAAEVGECDALVNNAGVMALPESRTADGFETQIATNHLGHFALTNLLLPRIRDRVVVVGSHAHRHGHLDVEDLFFQRRGYRAYAAYAQSKLANLLFLLELQRRLGAAGSTVRALGAHPGYTATGIQGHTGSRSFTGLATVGNRLVGMKPRQGALPILMAATADLPGNSYLGPHRRTELHGWPTLAGRSQQASDPDLARALWLKSESLTGVSWPLGPVG